MRGGRPRATYAASVSPTSGRADPGPLSEALVTIRRAISPGTPVRDGLDRINRGGTGALVVVGWGPVVEALCTGGFELDVEFSATRLRELAKMDGAVVINGDATRILRAAVHLVPDPSIVTSESGTRHRTAERVAVQTGLPVITVSQSMHVIALYAEGGRYVLDDSSAILARANQAIATLERYKLRLDEVAGTLSALEMEDLVTVRDVLAVVQRLEMVRRIAAEVEGYLIELGSDGRLLELQLHELMAGVQPDRELVLADYHVDGFEQDSTPVLMDALDALSGTDLLDLAALGRVLGYGTGPDQLEVAVAPRGYRVLARLPRLPRPVTDRLVEHFDGLQPLLGATLDDLMAVDGIGENRARMIRDGLQRMSETNLLDRFI